MGHICCKEKIKIINIFDDPKTGYAFNLSMCDNCGSIFRENVWKNEGFIKLPPGENKCTIIRSLKPNHDLEITTCSVCGKDVWWEPQKENPICNYCKDLIS